MTNLGVMRPDENGELVLTAMHPGVTYEQVAENTGWPLKMARDCAVTEPPNAEELRILREDLDPQRIYI